MTLRSQDHQKEVGANLCLIYSHRVGRFCLQNSSESFQKMFNFCCEIHYDEAVNDDEPHSLGKIADIALQMMGDAGTEPNFRWHKKKEYLDVVFTKFDDMVRFMNRLDELGIGPEFSMNSVARD